MVERNERHEFNSPSLPPPPKKKTLKKDDRNKSYNKVELTINRCVEI